MATTLYLFACALAIGQPASANAADGPLLVRLTRGQELYYRGSYTEEASGAGVQVVGDASRPVQRVAVACGASGEFLGDAVAAGADVFLTGEARFHDLLAAQASNMALILPGHYATERCGIEAIARR